MLGKPLTPVEAGLTQPGQAVPNKDQEPFPVLSAASPPSFHFFPHRAKHCSGSCRGSPGPIPPPPPSCSFHLPFSS